ncbi:MAG TPA: hypothetical protein DCG75_01640 [Bacteroidales bacterium]|nr:hypothetical protein [Bacteroidales bacterium]
MSFWYLNKQNKEALIFGSITSLCRYTGMKPDNFYTHFGRLNNTEFENENVRIVKTEIKRGGK